MQWGVNGFYRPESKMVYDMTIEQLNKRVPVEWGRKESIHSDRRRLKNVGSESKGPKLEEHNHFSEENIYEADETDKTVYPLSQNIHL